MARFVLTPEQIRERREAFEWGLQHNASWQAMADRIGMNDETYRKYAQQNWPAEFAARLKGRMPKPTVTNIDEAEVERRLAGYRRAVEHHLTLRQIADELGMIDSALGRWLRSQGLNLKLDQLKALHFDAPKPKFTQRFCLRCRDAFASEHAGHRMCGPCRGYSASPYEPASDGDGGRRVGRAR